MPDIDAKKIAELRSLLAKATLGPWSTHLVDDTTIMSPAREVATTCDSSQTDREDGYNIEYEQMEADAALIVAMRNAMPALLDLASLSLASASGEDGKLLRVIDETLQAMASQASVPMDLWDKHSNTVLSLMAHIRTLSAQLAEARREGDLYRRAYGCLSCGECHPPESMCPPHEVRSSGMGSHRQQIGKAVARATASEAQAAALRERVWVLEKALELARR